MTMKSSTIYYVNKRITRQKIVTMASCIGYKAAIEIIKKLQRIAPNSHYYQSSRPSNTWDGKDNVLVQK